VLLIATMLLAIITVASVSIARTTADWAKMQASAIRRLQRPRQAK
jgi:hypothetical protein